MRNFILSSVLFVALNLVSVGNASANGFQADPAVACDFLAQEGLRTRGGYQGSGDIHRCSSRRRNVISGGGINNSIRFVAQGYAQTVRQLRLELQVNSLSGVQRAHRTLAEHAMSLTKKALGVDMPGEIEAAILSAVPGTWSVNSSTVTLERIVAGAAGYELRFRIQ